MTQTSIDITATSVGNGEPDAVGAAAVDLARAAAQAVAGHQLVGEHQGVEADGDRLVTHFFACTDRAYTAWRWAVTVVRAPRLKTVTVDEVVLLPGPGALLAPPWVPWSERLQAGDLGIGDVLPTAADDERLVPGYAAVGPHDETDDPDTIDALVNELWLGRPRVLSEYGRLEAAERWYEGDRGPAAPIARAADLHCASCGFLVLMRGALSRVFGVCANEYAPDDGHVVSFDHGCGAHSEALVAQTEPLRTPDAQDVVVDEIVAAEAVAEVAGEIVPDGIDDAEIVVDGIDAEIVVGGVGDEVAAEMVVNDVITDDAEGTH
ncbi:MAG TPA: DUF3027 domain-containing protein [Acidothermaceae bacterium]|nr:DUF3027 domain-containing protein [Acidothermaceae bacterium]